MDNPFLTILNMSLTGAFVIAAICLARLPLKKAPKIISYCLWAVAGFRLVFPYPIEGVFSLIPFKAQTIPPDIAMQPIPRIDSGIPFVNNAVSGILPAATPTASVNPLQIWMAIGAWIWIVGVAVLLIYGVVSFFILKRKMSDAAHMEANIFEAKNITSPFVLGVFKPRIYLPVGLSEQEKGYIILHEQTHIKRHDHIVKLAAYFILCLHWFNPFAWVAFLLMGVDMEMSCDERVLKEMGDETKKEYSLSLLSLATERRMIGGSPLAFGEGGVKERIKNVLNFKKPSRVIITAAVALVAVLCVGFAVNRVVAIEKSFPMQGVHLSDLQPDEIVRNIVQITGAKSDDVIVPGLNSFQMQVTDNFEWQLSGTISMYISKNSKSGEPNYACQLRIFPDDLNFFITEPERQEPPARQYLLLDYLNALKYLPQEYIRNLTHDNPDMYLINFVGDGVYDDNQPCVYYNKHGITDNSGWTIRFDIQPAYRDENGSGYHGVGSDTIHVFYKGDETTALREITLSELRALAKKGGALQYSDFPFLHLSPLSSIMGGYNPTLYSVEGGYRLLINFNDTMNPESGIRSTALESIWDSGGSGIDIRYEDVDEFIRTHPSHPADTVPSTTYSPRKWVDFYRDTGLPWTSTYDLMLDEFPGVMFSWTSGKVTATENNVIKDLFTGMPIWNVYLADLNGDGLPELCATVSIGSGIIDTRIAVYDYANDRLYDLSDRAFYDYFLSIEDNRLIVTQTSYDENSSRAIGSMAIINGELVTFGIDRTLPKIEPQETTPPVDTSFLSSWKPLHDLPADYSKEQAISAGGLCKYPRHGYL